MGRNSRIEFNDFDGNEKNKEEKEESVFHEEDIDTDVVDMEDVIREDTDDERRNIRPKSSLFEDSENLENIDDIIGIADVDDLDDIDGIDNVGGINDNENGFENDFADIGDSGNDWIENDFDEEPEKSKSKAVAVADAGPISADFDDDQDDMFDPRNKKIRKKIQKTYYYHIVRISRDFSCDHDWRSNYRTKHCKSGYGIQRCVVVRKRSRRYDSE